MTVLVDVSVHVRVAVIDYPYPSGYGTAIGDTAQAASFSSGLMNPRIHERCYENTFLGARASRPQNLALG